MACPIKSAPEWVRMVSEFDEDTAMRLFIANGELMPSMEQIDKYIESAMPTKESDIELQKGFNRTAYLKKKVSANRPQLSFQQFLNLNKRIIAYNKANGTKHSLNKKQVGQADLYTWEIVEDWNGKALMFEQGELELQRGTEQPIKIEKKLAKDIAVKILDKLSSRFNLPYEILTIEQAREKYPDFELKAGTKGFFVNNEGTIVGIEGIMTWDTPFHEFLHPFLKLLKKQNKALYDSLFNQIVELSKVDKSVKALLDERMDAYKDLKDEALKEEIIATFLGWESQGALEESMRNAPPEVKTGWAKLIQSLKDAWSYIIKLFKSTFKNEILEKEISLINVAKLSPNTTLRDFAKIMAVDDSMLDLTPAIGIESEEIISEQRGSQKAEPKREPKTQEEKIREAVNNVVHQLSVQVQALKQQDQTGRTSKKIEQVAKNIGIIQAQLEAGELLKAVYQYIDYAEQMTKLSEDKMNEIKSALDNGVITEKQRRQKIKRMAELNEYLSFFTEFDSLARYVQEKGLDQSAHKAALYDKLMAGEITKEEFEKALETANRGYIGKIADIKRRSDMLINDYREYGMPYLAKVLYSAIDWGKSNQQWQDWIDNIKRGNKTRDDVASKHQDYERKMHEAKVNKLSDNEIKVIKNGLAIDYLRGKIMTEEKMVELLKENPSDITFMQKMFYDTMSVSDVTLSTFAKVTMDALEVARIKSINTKNDLGAEYHEYQKASNSLGSNVEEFNDPFIDETVSHHYNYETGEYDERVELSFVKHRDYNKFYKNRYEFVKKLNEKYKDILPLMREIAEKRAELKDAGKTKQQINRAIWDDEYFNSIYKKYTSYYAELNDWEAEHLETRTQWKVFEDGVIKDISNVADYIAYKQRNIHKIYGQNGIADDYSRKKYDEWLENNTYTKYLSPTETTTVYKGMELRQPKKRLYTNTKYDSMKSNAAQFKLYNAYLNQYLSDQQKLPYDKRRGYTLPSIEKDSMDRLREQGVKSAVKRGAEKTFTIVETQDEFALNDIRKESSKRMVPIYYTNYVNAKDVSRDLISSMLLFNKMANKYAALNELSVEADLLMDIYANVRETRETTSKGTNVLGSISQRLKNSSYIKKSKADENNSLSLLKGFLDMVFYGEEEKKAMFHLFGKEISANKLAGAVTSYTALTTLAGNMMAGISNITMGNIMNFIEGHAGNSYSASDYRKALGHVLSTSAPGYIQDFNKVSGLHKDTQLIELFDMIQGKFDDEYGRQIGGDKLKQSLRQKSLLLINNVGEFQIQVANGLAHLYSFKIKNKKGEFINKKGDVVSNEKDAMNLYDAFEFDSKGNLKLNDKVGNFSMDDIVAFSGRVRAISQRLHGVYNQFGKSQAQRTVLGKMAFLFRRWIVGGMRRRYQGYRIDVAQQEVEVGNYYAFFKALTNETGEMLKFITLRENTMTDIEKRATKKTLLELGYLTSAYLLFSLMAGLKGDDDDTYLSNLTAYQSRRLASELGFFMPPFALTEAGKILKSPMASISMVENVYKFMGQTLDPFEEYQRKSGIHEKGDSKWVASLENLIPVISKIDNIASPELSIRQFTDSYSKKEK